jgi:hypothetical protein
MLGISRKVFIVAERFSVVLMQDNLAKRSMIVQLVLQVKIYFFILFRFICSMWLHLFRHRIHL